MLAFLAISWLIYVFPDYAFLEEITARHAAGIMRLLGQEVHSYAIDGAFFLDRFEMTKDCTGIQVIAFFAGLLIPARGIPVWKKTLMFSSASSGVFVINVFRVSILMLVYRLGFLGWTSAHDFLGEILSAAAVFTLVMFYSVIVPEFKEFLLGMLGTAWRGKS